MRGVLSNGINFTTGESDPAEDGNYMHWSLFSHMGNRFRNESVLDVNKWTIRFERCRAGTETIGDSDHPVGRCKDKH